MAPRWLASARRNQRRRRCSTIWLGRRRDYDGRGPDLAPALQSKLDTFGRSANPYRVPTPPRFVGLIGQQTSRLRIADGDCAVAVDYLSDFSQMNRDGAVVPFEFAGQFEGELPAEGPPFLAVSINGTVRAVTRGWRAAPREWLATPGARCMAQRHECRGSVQDRGVVERDVAAQVYGSRGPFTLIAEAPDRQSVHRTRPRAPRVATATAGARGAGLPATASGCPDREGRQGLLQVRALAGRTRRRLLPAHQHLEVRPALAASVLVNRHATIIAGRDFLCEIAQSAIRNPQSAILERCLPH